jgi:hypothetical protein
MRQVIACVSRQTDDELRWGSLFLKQSIQNEGTDQTTSLLVAKP